MFFSCYRFGLRIVVQNGVNEKGITWTSWRTGSALNSTAWCNHSMTGSTPGTPTTTGPLNPPQTPSERRASHGRWIPSIPLPEYQTNPCVSTLRRRWVLVSLPHRWTVWWAIRTWTIHPGLRRARTHQYRPLRTSTGSLARVVLPPFALKPSNIPEWEASVIQSDKVQHYQHVNTQD